MLLLNTNTDKNIFRQHVSCPGFNETEIQLNKLFTDETNMLQERSKKRDPKTM